MMQRSLQLKLNSKKDTRKSEAVEERENYCSVPTEKCSRAMLALGSLPSVHQAAVAPCSSEHFSPNI